jgi:hypothetical protein
VFVPVGFIVFVLSTTALDRAKLNGVLVRLHGHTTVYEGANNFGRVTLAGRQSVQDSVARNDEPIASEMSNELVSNVSSTLTNITDTLSNQQNSVTSFNALMKKFEPLVKIADEVAKVVHLYLHWTIWIDHFSKSSILMSIWRGKCFLSD